MPVTEYKVPNLPPHWMTDCKELSEYDSGNLETILLTHGHNMEAAGICRARHNALITKLKELQ